MQGFIMIFPIGFYSIEPRLGKEGKVCEESSTLVVVSHLLGTDDGKARKASPRLSLDPPLFLRVGLFEVRVRLLDDAVKECEESPLLEE